MLAAACSAAPAPSLAGDAQAGPDLTRLRSATRSFANLDSAVAAGWPREVAECLVHEHHGAMGYHHVNRANVVAPLDVARPQILLYERATDGRYKLNGVEYILPYNLYSRDSVAPALFGQRLHREDNLKFWYLHVWAWSDNPDGVFANFNPSVACPAGKGKAYKPFTRAGD